MTTYKNTTRRLERLERASITPARVGVALHTFLDVGDLPTEPALAQLVGRMAASLAAMEAVALGFPRNDDEPNSLIEAVPTSEYEFN